MKTVFGTDAAGKVWLISNGELPAQWNGSDITSHILTDDQCAAFAALPSRRGDIYFVDGIITATPPVEVPQRLNPSKAELLEQLSALKAKVDALL
jgi:hypothetical protein